MKNDLVHDLVQKNKTFSMTEGGMEFHHPNSEFQHHVHHSKLGGPSTWHHFKEMYC